MATVSSADLRAAFRFTLEASDAAALELLPRPVLTALGELIPADFVEHFELHRDRSVSSWSTSHDRHDPNGSNDAPSYMWQNPLGAFKWRPSDGPRRLSTVISSRQLEKLEYFDTYLQPLRIRDQLKVWLSTSAEAAICVSLDRSDGFFSDRDAAVLGVLQPHLAAMCELASSRSLGVDAEEDVRLTQREAQVLSLAASGRQTAEIARLLFISPATVRKHLERAYARLGVRNRAEAAVRLMQRGPNA